MKEDASSPTVSTEAVMLTCVIDANENRDVTIVDIPNAFVQTVVEDKKGQSVHPHPWSIGSYLGDYCT